jgi:hypothetical protein
VKINSTSYLGIDSMAGLPGQMGNMTQVRRVHTIEVTVEQ